jgi:uncharacterized membrane protein
MTLALLHGALPAWFQLDVVLTNSIAVAMLISGVTIALKGARSEANLSEKFILCAPVFFAVPMAVFGAEHFLEAASISKIIPRWVPAHLFLTYFVGVCLIAASFSIVFRKLSGLAAALTGVMFLFFEALMHIPIAVKLPHNRLAWVILARDFIFSWGAFSLAATYMTNWRLRAWLVSAARLSIGGFIVFVGIEHFLHPELVPGFPLQQATPSFIPGHVLFGCLTGIVYVVGGSFLFIDRREHLASLWLGIYVFCSVLLFSVPFMIQQAGVAGLNVPLDNLMLSGALLCLSAALAGKSISSEKGTDRPEPAVIPSVPVEGTVDA